MEAHAHHATPPEAHVHVVQDVMVGGGGTYATQGGRYVYAEPAYPGYVHEYLKQDISPETWRHGGWRLTRRVPRAFAVLHSNLMWGHWLLEVFPKLFAIRALNARGVHAPILISSNAPSYVPGIIQDVLPGQEVIAYNPARRQVNVGRLILPPMLQRFYVFHPAFGEAIDAYAAGARRAGTPERVFVSRGGMRTDWAYRELENEPELEAVAAEMGFAVVRPETLPWREQLALFSGARVVAGEFGSGIHNTLFSPAGTKVVALNCIGDTQSRIANFRRQDIGYVLADDGQPRVFHGGAQLQRFRVDPGAFRSALTTAVAAAEESA